MSVCIAGGCTIFNTVAREGIKGTCMSTKHTGIKENASQKQGTIMGNDQKVSIPVRCDQPQGHHYTHMHAYFSSCRALWDIKKGKCLT